MTRLLGWIGAACMAITMMLSGPAAAQSNAAVSTLRPSGTTLCTDVTGISQSDGAAVIVWTCNGQANQSWQLQPVGTAYQLIAQHSGKCLDITGISLDAGAPAIQWACNGQPNQQFTLRQQGTGYAIVAAHSAKCLVAQGGGNPQAGQQVVQMPCDGSASQTWEIDGLHTPPPQAVTLPSSWTAPQALPIVPVAAANLPNGKVLTWSSWDPLNFGGDGGQTYTVIFDPATGNSSEMLVSNTGHDMFCPGIANLPDGRIFVNGGSSDTKTSIFDPATLSWSAGPLMNIGRGYNGSVTLTNGGVFTLGGSWDVNKGNKNGETWLPGTGWQLNSAVFATEILTADGAGIYRADNHAWMFAVSNGRVFHAGPSKSMHWIDTAGSGSITWAGERGGDADAMNGNAVMYDIGKILTIGGAPSYDSTWASANANLIDINGGTAKVRQVAAMAYARAFHNSVVLPNGQVVVIGGQTYPRPFSDDLAVLTAELWDPATETFQLLAPMATPRNYHSVALLLPDGRVLSGGGGLCGTCSTNHPSVEILTPPYLLNPDGSAATRPVIVSAPSEVSLGTSIAVTTNSPVTNFSLLRMASATHSLDNEQRRVPVNFTTGTAGEYLINIPSDPGIVVPGYYMLFALNNKGVPSVAKTLRIY
ncbi:RICIN domain-containing protein [Paraburkholderia youngii]|uniref:RICIN domain-containing protein n=1 Tax=Paraburkholderia youngii TaxID=2782701 RepID=UPI003D23E588